MNLDKQLNDRIDELLAEIERLKARDTCVCSYCGLRMQGDQGEAMRAHTHTCDQHPLRAAEAEIERLRAGCEKLSYALDQIDCAIMSKEIVKRDTEMVGGPVSEYCVWMDEEAVVERVTSEIKRLREALLKAEIRLDQLARQEHGY